VDLAGQLLAGADIRVLGLLEEALQGLELLVREDGAVAPLPAAVQLVEELQLGARQAAHVHVGHQLVRHRGQQHRTRAVVACAAGRGAREKRHRTAAARAHTHGGRAHSRGRIT